MVRHRRESSTFAPFFVGLVLLAAGVSGFGAAVPEKGGTGLLEPATLSFGQYHSEWSDEPSETHERIEWLCAQADPQTALVGAAGASRWTPAPGVVPDVHVPASADYAGAVLDLYAALGVEVTPAQVRELDVFSKELPEEVARPMGMVVQATAEAARLNARALEELTHDELRLLAEHMEDGSAVHSPTQSGDLAAKVASEYQVAGALHVLRALEAARPLMEQAVEDDAWPAFVGVGDPLGLVYIGGTGDDVDHSNRVVMVSPGGNDYFGGRIGAADPLSGSWPILVRGYPVGVAFNLAGDDTYEALGDHPHNWGAAAFGVGVFWDAAGDDTYHTRSAWTLGLAHVGVGVFVDETGDDSYHPNVAALGSGGGAAIGIALELGGNDTYVTELASLGYASNSIIPVSVGFFCDHGGKDTFNSDPRGLGFARHFPELHAWFVSLGGEEDAYNLHSTMEHPAANNRYWTRGSFGGIGYGVDQ